MGILVAQWVKWWPTDLEVPGSSPTRGEIFLTINGVPLHTAFHYHPPIVLLWLKYCWKGLKVASHPSIFSNFLQLCKSVSCTSAIKWVFSLPKQSKSSVLEGLCFWKAKIPSFYQRNMVLLSMNWSMLLTLVTSLPSWFPWFNSQRHWLVFYWDHINLQSITSMAWFYVYYGWCKFQSLK